MSTLREDFEALMPEPWQCFQHNPGWNNWENVIPGARGEPGVVVAYTADQVREAMKAVAERCAELNKGQAYDAHRLDHLQNRGATVEILPDGSWWKFRVGGLRSAESPNIRAAIDAAISEGRS